MQTSSKVAQELFDNDKNLVASGNRLILSETAIVNVTKTMYSFTVCTKL